MKKIISVLALFLVARAFSQETADGKWRSMPIAIDGFGNEWSAPLRFYNSEASLFFAILNDSTNLYLCFEVRDEQTQTKINEAGMRIELKSKGKLKCDASIDFPLMEKKEQAPPAEEGAEAGAGKKRHAEADETRNTYILQNVSLLARGFATQNGLLPVKDSAGIDVALNWDTKGEMAYELKIPLKELFGPGFSLQDVTKAISMRVEVNAFARPESSGGGSTGMPGGGMPGGNGSGATINGGMTGAMPPRGGSGHHGGGPSSPMYEVKTLKQSFTLATAPPAH